MLQAHIFNLHGNEGAIVNGLVKGFAGVVGVDVNLDDLIVVHQHQAVTQAAEEFPQLLRVVFVLPGDDELSAVGEGDVLGVKVGEGGLLGNGFDTAVGSDDFLAPGGAEHSLQHHYPALTAGIYYTGLFQNRVLINGVSKGDFGFLESCLVDGFEVLILTGNGHCLGRCQSGDGQNGAFGRLHNCLISGIHTFLQRLRPKSAIADFSALQLPGNAPQQQGQNHAGVASCAPEHSGCGNGRRLLQGGILCLPQVCGCGVDGHRHIGTGVAVRHREYV